jgi:hypothetical protein
MLLVLNFSGAMTRPIPEHVAWPMAWPGMASGHHGLRPFRGLGFLTRGLRPGRPHAADSGRRLRPWLGHGLGSISFRTRVNGLVVLACLTPHPPPPPRRGPEIFLHWESGEIRKFTIGSRARYTPPPRHPPPTHSGPGYEKK